MSSKYEQLIDQISVMLKLESTIYQRFDYMKGLEKKNSSRQKIEGQIIKLRRSKVANWMFQVVDAHGLSREIVSVGMSLLDGFYGRAMAMDQFDALLGFQPFQLVSLTTFSLALKLSNNRSFNALDLCAGKFDMSHLIEMERFVLQVLTWHVHPPTPTEFVKFCMLLQFHCHHAELQNGLDLQTFIPVYDDVSDYAIFLTEVAELDYHFVSFKPSTIAFASILNSLQLIEPSRCSLNLHVSFLQLLEDILGQSRDSQDVISCRQRIRQAQQNSEVGETLVDVPRNDVMSESIRVDSFSPRGIFEML